MSPLPPGLNSPATGSNLPKAEMAQHRLDCRVSKGEVDQLADSILKARRQASSSNMKAVSPALLLSAILAATPHNPRTVSAALSAQPPFLPSFSRRAPPPPSPTLPSTTRPIRCDASPPPAHAPLLPTSITSPSLAVPSPSRNLSSPPLSLSFSPPPPSLLLPLSTPLLPTLHLLPPLLPVQASPPRC